MKKIFLLLTIFIITACKISGTHNEFTILSGSENETLEPIIKEFNNITGNNVKLVYKGSLDMMLLLESNSFRYDAVWPANSIWLKLSENANRIKHLKSIMTTPVVLGLKKSIASRLGWIGKNIRVKDIFQAIKNGEFKFLMTSATQSNSGASAYFGFIYAFLNNPEVIQSSMLNDPELRNNIKTLLKGVERSSGSSGWLKDLFLKKDYNAMFNYEALIIETNRELISRNQEPLYVIYPSDGMVIADSPLGYYNRGDNAKEEIFKALQKYLLSESVQQRLVQMGRRAGFGGVITHPDQSIWNIDWGIKADKILSPIKYPEADVIRKMLTLYQTVLRKPSYTIFCLDYSGSMAGRGERELKEAMRTLLNQKIAGKYYLNATPNDIISVIAFSSDIIVVWTVKGNSDNELNELYQKVFQLRPSGSTDIYSPVIHGLKILSENTQLENYMPAVILMTDGESNYGKSFRHLEETYKALKKDIPVFSIMFGAASKSQLENIAFLTNSLIFDGRKDLISAFRKAKGYN